ncbi:GNAT family N-acetyltransferase [Aurantiacibacter aquimixticola]|uniref:N-acetyltransferase n=1 Tax=Aurantiacibacter aquimixticola TaxID=1958945 RepID=A0A419RUE8_9SPHN|nr:N-acetyltransferase [Aurantiacibacter aquimixticola]RJY09417.1 N-acetyltransferase [Aurantiacibacter aquimixticola]
MSCSIRDEAACDADAIRGVVERAFAGHAHSDGTEPDIVERLRRDRSPSVSLVAEDAGNIVGHIAFSPVTIDDGAIGWFGLGPVSVDPYRQGEGIGSALCRHGLLRIREQGAMGCVVLGDPGFYARFGFACDPALTFPGVPPEYFQRLRFGGRAPRGEVTYAPAFG